MSNWLPGYSHDQLNIDNEQDRQFPDLAQPLYSDICLQSDIPTSTFNPYDAWNSSDSVLTFGNPGYHIVEAPLDLAPYHEGVSKIEDIPIHDLTTKLDAQPWHGVTTSQVHTAQEHRYDVHGATKDEKYRTLTNHYDEGYYSLGTAGSSRNALYEQSYTPQCTVTNGLKRKASTYAASEAQSRVTSTSTRRKSLGPIGDCSVCGRVSKNKSDANKHAKTHEKPYKCRIAGCSKSSIGFGTPNDLQRHELCKHRIIPDNTPCVKGWICSVCPSSPDNPPKWRPRLDNFRAHLKRKHKELCQDHDKIVLSSQQDFRLNETISEKDEVFSASYSNYNGTSHADTEMHYQYDSAPQVYQSASFTTQSIQAGEGMPWLDELNSDHLVDLVIAHQADSDSLSIRQHVPCTYATNRDDKHEIQLLACSGAAVLALAVEDQSYEFARMAVADPILQHEKHDPNVDEEFTKHDTTTGPHLSRIEEESDSKGAVCDKCGYYGKKVNGQLKQLRQCDLNKHIRSVHDRVYGCTHPHCQHGSRSKSDWRRHEDTKHKCPAAWLCRERLPNGTFCNQYFMTDDDLWARHHLRKKHRLSEYKLDEVLQSYKLPRKGMTRFWCGFCNEVQLNPAQDEDEAWNHRLNHIGEHMDMKGHRSIRDWICPAWQKPKGTITSKMEADFLLLPPLPLPQ